MRKPCARAACLAFSHIEVLGDAGLCHVRSLEKERNRGAYHTNNNACPERPMPKRARHGRPFRRKGARVNHRTRDQIFHSHIPPRVKSQNKSMARKRSMPPSCLSHVYTICVRLGGKSFALRPLSHGPTRFSRESLTSPSPYCLVPAISSYLDAGARKNQEQEDVLSILVCRIAAFKTGVREGSSKVGA